MLPQGLCLADRYRIERFVACGGMGEVYEVLDRELGERVALKTVASQFSGDAKSIAQLKVEVQLARRVSHRNVCRIYDIGIHAPQEGPPIVFLTMEYIHGESLAQRLRREGPLPPQEARRLACGILEGLSEAHEAGVLHRDLKDENVMLRERGDAATEPVLMDFGLASALNPNTSRVSAEGALVGSLAFMAPEQVQGEALRVTTDLYAFGVIFFEMLTGCLPFTASTPAVSAIKRLQEDAPSIKSIEPSLPDDLEAIVAHCLERDPKRRFETAQQVLGELRGSGAVSRPTPSAKPGPSATERPSDSEDGKFAQPSPVDVNLSPKSSGDDNELPPAASAREFTRTNLARVVPTQGWRKERRPGWIVAALVAGVVGALAVGAFRAPASEGSSAPPTVARSATPEREASEPAAGEPSSATNQPPSSGSQNGESVRETAHTAVVPKPATVETSRTGADAPQKEPTAVTPPQNEPKAVTPSRVSNKSRAHDQARPSAQTRPNQPRAEDSQAPLPRASAAAAVASPTPGNPIGDTSPRASCSDGLLCPPSFSQRPGPGAEP